MRVIERRDRHYEVQEVPHGKVYSWRPEQVLFECDCGETLTWKNGRVECRCGSVYEGLGREKVQPREEEGDYHPWIEEYEEWRKEKVANGLQHEYYGFVPDKGGE